MHSDLSTAFIGTLFATLLSLNTAFWTDTNHPTTTTTRTRNSELLLGMVVNTEKVIADLGIELPPPPPPAANYIPAQKSGNLLYFSGHIPFQNDGTLITGKVGTGGKTTEEAYQAARQVGLNLIATMKNELGGDLDRVEQIVKLFGIVHSTDDFYEQHKVLNGCSDVMVQIFGKERGVHSRSAIGTNALPLGVSVEIEAIVRVKDD